MSLFHFRAHGWDVGPNQGLGRCGAWKEPKRSGSIARIEIDGTDINTLPTHTDVKQDLWTRYRRGMIIINIEHVILRTLIFMHGYSVQASVFLMANNSIKHSLPLIGLPQNALLWVNAMERLLEDHEWSKNK